MCDRDNYRLLRHLSRVVDEGVNSVHREFNADTSGFFRAPRVSRPFQHFLPFNCFNIPKRSFILSAGVNRISLTCFDRRIPWLTKPPGCFCFLDSFVCLSKLLALFFFPFGLFFFLSKFSFRLVGFMTLFYVGHLMSKKGEETGSYMGIACEVVFRLMRV